MKKIIVLIVTFFSMQSDLCVAHERELKQSTDDYDITLTFFWPWIFEGKVLDKVKEESFSFTTNVCNSDQSYCKDYLKIEEMDSYSHYNAVEQLTTYYKTQRYFIPGSMKSAGHDISLDLVTQCRVLKVLAYFPAAKNPNSVL